MLVDYVALLKLIQGAFVSYAVGKKKVARQLQSSRDLQRCPERPANSQLSYRLDMPTEGALHKLLIPPTSQPSRRCAGSPTEPTA